MNRASLAMALLSGACMALVAACGGGGVPTYSDILATYPPDADLCGSEGDLVETPDGGVTISPGPSAVLSVVDGQFTIQCYGTKLTVKEPVTLDGKTYEPGTKLTVDKDLQWTEVSSWN